MSILLSVLVTLPLLTLVDATLVTFSKRGEQIYVGTDSKHYAMYGQLMGGDGVTIIAIDDNDRNELTSKCDFKRTKLNELDKETRKSYKELRSVLIQDPAKTLVRSFSALFCSFIWQRAFLADSDKLYEQQVFERIGTETTVYSSNYFPDWLARVIISGQVISFVHYSGTVVMKTLNCLYRFERIFIEGIKQIDTSGKKRLFFRSSLDKVLKQHLHRNSFDEGQFKLEQEYIGTR